MVATWWAPRADPIPGRDTTTVNVAAPMNCCPSHGLQAGTVLDSDFPYMTCDLRHVEWKGTEVVIAE